MGTIKISQEDILSQSIQLYELSLAVGQSTSLLDNCRHFFDRILARRNLSYAALWLRNSIDTTHDEFLLAYSDPQTEYLGPDILDKDSPLFDFIKQHQIISIDSQQLQNFSWYHDKLLPNGDSFTFIQLDELGAIILAGYGTRGLWEEWQLNQLIPIFKSFATSICSNLHFEQLQIEIVERKNAELKFKHASEVKTQFLTNMSHELRTPLNAILGMTQLLEDTLLDNEQEDMVDTISDSGHSLLALIDNILDFSRLETDKVHTESELFELNHIINELHHNYQQECHAKNLNIEVSIDTCLPRTFIGDPNRLSQILSNLLSNAVKFTERGTITLTVQPQRIEQDFIMLEIIVADTGIGILPENLETMFDSFSQIDASITRQFGGTGLGLTICKQLVEIMHGNITVSSQLNKGSQFKIQLPFTIPSEPYNSINNTQSIPVAQLNTVNATILLVDDDPFNQLIAQKILNKIGYETHLANNGEEAIKRVKQESYDLIFMDINMPGMDGIEATKSIRHLQKELTDSKVPILAMTATSDDHDQTLCRQAGMNDILNKPISRQILTDLLQRWLPTNKA